MDASLPDEKRAEENCLGSGFFYVYHFYCYNIFYSLYTYSLDCPIGRLKEFAVKRGIVSQPRRVELEKLEIVLSSSALWHSGVEGGSVFSASAPLAR